MLLKKIFSVHVARSEVIQKKGSVGSLQRMANDIRLFNEVMHDGQIRASGSGNRCAQESSC